jgi:hypothetical protein
LPSAIESDSGTTSEKRARDFQMKKIHGATNGATTNPTPSEGNMKLIPWSDIWLSLKAAKCRGHGEMIEVFYDTLFKEATFDDKGAWSRRIRR